MVGTGDGGWEGYERDTVAEGGCEGSGECEGGGWGGAVGVWIWWVGLREVCCGVEEWGLMMSWIFGSRVDVGMNLRRIGHEAAAIKMTFHDGAITSCEIALPWNSDQSSSLHRWTTIIVLI